VPHTNAAFSYVDGDSTVPTDSAMGHGLDATATVAIKGAHRDLVGMEVSRAGWGVAEACWFSLQVFS
jgi:hypothetical protein